MISTFTLITQGGEAQSKLADEISLDFSELFIIGKYVKIRFKGLSGYFLISRAQEIKAITKIEQKRLFLFAFLVSRAKHLHSRYII